MDLKQFHKIAKQERDKIFGFLYTYSFLGEITAKECMEEIEDVIAKPLKEYLIKRLEKKRILCSC